jgi:hypothetical protein
MGDGQERRIEIVRCRRRDERLGQLRDAPHQVSASLGIQLTEHVVEQEQRRAAIQHGEQVELGQLERQDRRALLPARREPRQVAAREVECQIVPVRSDDGRSVPDLLLGRVDQPAGERFARRFANECRRVTDVAEGPAAASSGAISRWAAATGAAIASSSSCLAATTRLAVSRNVSSQNRSSSREACSSRMARSRLLRCWSVRPYVPRSSA